MFVERNPDKMEDNIRRMGNYLKLYRCTIYRNYTYFSKLHVYQQFTVAFFLGQGEEKSICILHPR